MKRLILTATGILLALCAYASEREVKFPVTLDLPGFQAGIYDVGAAYVSGQPSAEAFKKLAADGFTTVVCLRTQPELDDRDEVPFDEPALLKELKMDYVHIPIGDCNPAAVDKFASALANSKGKVLLHCTVAWRASYMWMAYLIRNRHYSVDEAWRAGMSMNITVDRTPLMLGQPVSYSARPKKDGSRTPKPGTLSKPGSHLTITSPKPTNAPSGNYMAFTMWDMGSLLNASQPDEAKLRELAAQGVKTVVNLRGPQEMEDLKSKGFDEEAVAKSLGMHYFSVPIQGWQTFTPEALAKVADAFDHAEGKVLFHCQSANRTTLVLVPYLVKYQGMSVDEATKVGESMRWNRMLQELIGMDISWKLAPRSKQGCGG